MHGAQTGGTMGWKRYEQSADSLDHREVARQPGELQVIALVIAGCAVGGLLIGVLSEEPLELLWRWVVLGALAPIGLLVASALIHLGIRSYNSGMWAVERRTRRDPDVGAHLVMVNPRIGQDEARRQSQAELRAEFERFIRGCKANTSMRYWLGQDMSRKRYLAFRDALMQAGYAGWIGEDEGQGWRLLLEPEEIIRLYARVL
jgi:hypothetical protein